MKKGLAFVVGVLAAIALVAWVASWFRADEAVATAAARPWPDGLGSLESAAARFPARQANAASVRLTALAQALPRDNAASDFISREVAKSELAIGEAPPLPDVAAIRDLLLRDEVVWGRRGGVGDIGDEQTTAKRALQMTMARTLVADALVKARADDPAAWDDLHAVWNLAGSLDRQPQMMQQTAAFSMARMVNAVAWKMPSPAPAWFAAVQEHDYVPRLLEAFQTQAASYWHDGARLFPTRWLSASVDRDRGIAEALARESRCDVHAPMNDLGVDLSSVWRRAFRYRAEREATANALRVREGKSIQAASHCTDGTWTFDGTTLRFSRDIATAPPDRPMPLALNIRSSSRR